MSFRPVLEIDPLEQIERLLAQRGGDRYGEHVTQQEHALQTALLAERAGASAELVAAAFLHDLGHLLAGEAISGVDDAHELAGARWLRPWFPEAVTRPIALHVLAKRYLCFAEPAYLAGLSASSLASLQAQGGAMSALEAKAFLGRAYAGDAVKLRRWDEAGKRRGVVTPGVGYFLGVVAGCRVG